MCVCVYIYICVCMCVCVYIAIELTREEWRCAAGDCARAVLVWGGGLSGVSISSSYLQECRVARLGEHLQQRQRDVEGRGDLPQQKGWSYMYMYK